MSEIAPNPTTDRPADDAKMEAIGYSLTVGFHPDIRLDKKDAGFEFARQLASLVEPQTVQIDPTLWTFSQPLGAVAGAGFFIRISANNIQFDFVYPTEAKEWIERRSVMILSEFEKQFKPKLILGSSVIVRGLVPVDGDARRFIGEHVMNMRKGRLQKLQRPIHLFGIRFFLPPFEVRTPSTKKGKKPESTITNWHVNVKAESMLDDPTKLFLEADAQWPDPKEWNKTSADEVVERLETVSSYLETDVMNFLRDCSTEAE